MRMKREERKRKEIEAAPEEEDEIRESRRKEASRS